MSPIIQKFVELLNRHKETFYRESVDLTELIEACNNATPAIQLKLSNDSDSVRNLADAIIRNLCKYAPHNTFPLYGLRAIHAIIRKDVSIDDTIAQQILVLHSTKMIMNVNSLSYMLTKLDVMTTEIRADQNIDGWMSIASVTIEHIHVRSLIDELIVKTFGNHLARRISETKDSAVEIVFCSTELDMIRGFSGFNAVYINRDHFDKKVLKSQDQDLILIDVVTVTIHELAHVRMRQVYDDLNTSTPTVITGSHNDDPEFGRIVERKLFGCAVDWLLSYANGTVPRSFIDDFLKSIRRNEDLPEVPVNAILYDRLYPVQFHVGGGADVSQR